MTSETSECFSARPIPDALSKAKLDSRGLGTEELTDRRVRRIQGRVGTARHCARSLCRRCRRDGNWASLTLRGPEETAVSLVPSHERSQRQPEQRPSCAPQYRDKSVHHESRPRSIGSRVDGLRGRAIGAAPASPPGDFGPGTQLGEGRNLPERSFGGLVACSERYETLHVEGSPGKGSSGVPCLGV